MGKTFKKSNISPLWTPPAFPETPQKPGEYGLASIRTQQVYLLLFHSEDVILKMYFRGEVSEAKEEEEGALTSPTKLALWLSCSLL